MSILKTKPCNTCKIIHVLNYCSYNNYPTTPGFKMHDRNRPYLDTIGIVLLGETFLMT